MIYDILPVNNYQGNNNATTFDFDFYIDNENQLKVYLFDEKGAKIELKNNVHYLIEGIQNQNGGYITFPLEDCGYEILNENQKISLELDLPVSQETQYNNSSLLNLEALEYSFDYLTRLIQILKRKLSLCVKVEECSNNSPQELIEMINESNINAQLSANQAKEFKNEAQNFSLKTSDYYLDVNKMHDEVFSFKDELVNSGMFKFNLFDTKISDHILEGNEAKGWALQGTYVTKESYPDFYQRCLEEYQKSESEQIEFIQPTLSSNGVLGGNYFAVETSEGDAYLAVDGDTTTECAKNGNATTSSYYTLYNPKAIQLVSIYLDQTDSASNEYCGGDIFASNDNSDWVQVGTFSKSITQTIELNLSEKYKYFQLKPTSFTTSGYWNLREIKLNGIVDSFYVLNSNGHKFYDILYKSAIDEIYNQYGIADFYGIDEVNERVFLPRNKYFHQLTDDASKVNEMIEAGLPNIEGKFAPINAVDTGVTANGAFKVDATWGVPDSNNGGSTAGRIALDASRSSEIYGNSNTVQPPSSLKLLYYCVGNTKVTNAITNVTEVTTSENDSNPLGSSFYFNNIQPNAGWLKSSGQWNDGNIYTTFYNWLVAEKTTNTLRTDIKDVSETYTDYDYVLNQDEMIFRLPLLKGDENLPSNKYQEMELKASGSTYVAPANGWFSIKLVTTAANQYIHMTNKTSGVSFTNAYPVTATAAYGTMECKKDDIVELRYTAGKLESFGFIYAQGNGSLYFKVANAVQNLELLDAGEVLEAVANHASQIHIIETYQNGTSWYRVYSDGWCEQGGTGNSNASVVGTITTTLLKTYANTNYTVLVSRGIVSTQSLNVIYKDNNSFQAQSSNTPIGLYYWQTSGYLA